MVSKELELELDKYGLFLLQDAFNGSVTLTDKKNFLKISKELAKGFSISIPKVAAEKLKNYWTQYYFDPLLPDKTKFLKKIKSFYNEKVFG